MTVVFVNPRSSKAKNRLANAMNNDNRMWIEQVCDDRIFAVSMSGNYCCWIKHYDDPHFDYLHQHPDHVHTN